jgi:hypothetical protein
MHRTPFDRLRRRSGRLLARLRRRSWADWAALAVAGGTVVATAVLLRVLPFRRVRRLMEGRRPIRVRRPLSSGEEQRLLWAVTAVSQRLLPNRPCLPQALAAQFLLRRRGARPAHLRIGVARNDDGSIEAHAWLERDGQVLLGGAESPLLYRPLSTGPDAA